MTSFFPIALRSDGKTLRDTGQPFMQVSMEPCLFESSHPIDYIEAYKAGNKTVVVYNPPNGVVLSVNVERESTVNRVKPVSNMIRIFQL